jgi:hypothetical protein
MPGAYEEAHLLLDARKACRDFVANPAARAGAYLSSLGGERESVLADGVPGPLRAAVPVPASAAASSLRLRMGMEPHEHLDAVGLAKRVLGRGLAFPSITRVALQAWVQSWSDDMCRSLGAVLDPLAAFDMVRRNACASPDPMARFPFDCELLLASRAEPSGGGSSRAKCPPSTGRRSQREGSRRALRTGELRVGASGDSAVAGRRPAACGPAGRRRRPHGRDLGGSCVREPGSPPADLRGPGALRARRGRSRPPAWRDLHLLGR